VSAFRFARGLFYFHSIIDDFHYHHHFTNVFSTTLFSMAEHAKDAAVMRKTSRYVAASLRATRNAGVESDRLALSDEVGSLHDDIAALREQSDESEGLIWTTRQHGRGLYSSTSQLNLSRF